MPQIAPKPIILNDIDLTVGADDYAASLSRVMATPTVPIAKWKGMKKGSGVNIVGEPDWVLDVTYAQDIESEESFDNYLRDHIGEAVEMTFRPKSGGVGFKVTVVIVPGAIGGDLGSTDAATASVQLPINGQPERVAAGA